MPSVFRFLSIVVVASGCAYAPFTPTASQTVRGAIVATQVDIPAGVTISTDRDLVIQSQTDVVIRGSIVAGTGGVSGRRGPSITIVAAGDVRIAGEIRAGNGVAGPSSK